MGKLDNIFATLIMFLVTTAATIGVMIFCKYVYEKDMLEVPITISGLLTYCWYERRFGKR